MSQYDPERLMWTLNIPNNFNFNFGHHCVADYCDNLRLLVSQNGIQGTGPVACPIRIKYRIGWLQQ